jgi:hypothetical protein
MTPSPNNATFTDSTLFIVSEGNYGKNNAELDGYSLKKDSLSKDIINPLGDIANDIQIFGKRMYVLLENSNKILNVNPDSIADRTSIQFTAGVTPFKMARVSPSEVWVTEFTGNHIDIMNLNSNSLVSSISVDTGLTDIGILGGKAFICTNANKLEVIDVQTRQVLSNKYLNDYPSQVITDSAHNAVIVLTSGSSTKDPGKIFWIDPATYNTTFSLAIDTLTYVNSIVPAGSKAFILYGDKVGALDLAAKSMTTLIAKGYYKGLYDATTNQLILGDAKDYSSPGVVDIYDATSGQLLKSIPSGIIPGHFVIYRK